MEISVLDTNWYGPIHKLATLPSGKNLFYLLPKSEVDPADSANIWL